MFTTKHAKVRHMVELLDDHDEDVVYIRINGHTVGLFEEDKLTLCEIFEDEEEALAGILLHRFQGDADSEPYARIRVYGPQGDELFGPEADE